MKKHLFSILPLKSIRRITKNTSYHDNDYPAFFTHEIRNLLNTVSGISSLLADSPLTPHQQSLLAEIISSTDSATELLNGFLQYSKTGTYSDKKSVFSLNSFLASVNTTYNLLASNKGISYDYNISIPDDLHIYFYKTGLFHILGNLLNNSLKYTDSGSVCLEVSLIGETSENVQVAFTVRDTGCGIPQDKISGIFNKYVRVSDDASSSGCGLGLYICSRLVSKYNGVLNVSSTSSGSCFSFVLNFEKSTLGIHDADIKGRRFLIVDDDYLNYEIISGFLKEYGCICDYAETAEDALTRCKSLPDDYYSLIFTDICMPGADGIRMARILKDGLHTSAPVVAVTGTECTSPHIDGCILKPFCKEEIIGTVEKAVKGNLNMSKAKAIERLGNREDLYDKYYSRFCENYAESAEDIRSMLSDNRYEDAYRLAHSIKGLSGTLGLTEVYNSASNLSESLCDKESASELCINELEASLKKLLLI